MPSEPVPSGDHHHGSGGAARGFVAWWQRTPLYIRILGGLVLGIVVGLILGPRAAPLEIPSKLILRLLGALAPMLILVAVIRALITAEIKGRTARRMITLLILNTTVAILIGLTVANVLRPGRWSSLAPPASPPIEVLSDDPDAERILGILDAQGFRIPDGRGVDPLAAFLENVPSSLLGPLTDSTKIIGVILIAVAFGIALRRFKNWPMTTPVEVVELAFETLLVVLHWVIDLVPIGVFGIVASIIGTQGFEPFLALGMFIVTVLVALLLQATYYLTRIRLRSWVRPMHLLRNTRDALIMAFSTGSSTATMPVTFECLRDKVGVRDESASMGALVGANFNNDGTALYEAVSALFIAQLIGVDLTLSQQFVVVLTSIVASVGAAGIPEAGLVTMTLVFRAVGLPIEYIALLLTVDWFLDRCRTTINIMGDLNVACLLDGKTPPSKENDPSLGAPPVEAGSRATDDPVQPEPSRPQASQ